MVSSIEWFAQKLYETLEIRGDGYVIDSLLDLAKAMHKDEMIKAWKNGDGQYDKTAEQFANDYYKQTYSDESNN